MSAITGLLSEFDNIPEADRHRTLSPEEQSKLLVILAHTVTDLSAEIVDLREENRQLRKALGPSTVHLGKNLFAVSAWTALKSAADVREAQAFFKEHFAKIGSNPQCRSMISSVTSMMSLAVNNPDLIKQDAFVDPARTLITELLVARERANGWRDTALEALRSSLLGVSLPSEISTAYEHARLATKMSEAVRPPPQKKTFPPRKQHRADKQ